MILGESKSVMSGFIKKWDKSLDLAIAFASASVIVIKDWSWSLVFFTKELAHSFPSIFTRECINCSTRDVSVIYCSRKFMEEVMLVSPFMMASKEDLEKMKGLSVLPWYPYLASQTCIG
ncbi:hypothetical protein TNIN_87651 [Trichonephila inaurata madagascariensis]|uniref:Uncharacterized protein n=1 Tax=Trichonephila inaurata madagascariensis TaxID=2747483 RepID=A0A8X7CQ18_9ARAC|nr:hypothetical protein TNIN_87651 [Trichonephila inaurata madagascariensis]